MNTDDQSWILSEDSQGNAIKHTRKIIKDMTEKQKFKKARAHVMDALLYKHPRPHSESPLTPLLFRAVYACQSSALWAWALFLGSYVYVAMAALDSADYLTKIAVQSSLLVLFWADTLMEAYCKRFDAYKGENRYSAAFLFKCCIILLMTIDLVIFIALPCTNARPIRPFRILRCFLPFIFDPEMRKTLISLASAYMDILVYFIFFSSVIAGYALLGNRALTFDPNYKDPNYPQSVDPYKTNYGDLLHMVFMVYVTATFDSYPDNQILAVQNYEANYIYYIIFIFANMFLFSSIPGSLIYLVFREKRSKLLLVDEMKQQHSLVLAFVTLTDEDQNLPIDRLIKFLLFLYKYKIRFVEYITDICLRLDSNNNRSIQINEFMQFSKILLENEAMLPPRFDDFEPWLLFRRYMNETLNLKDIVKHWAFELTVSIVIVLSFINAIFFMFNYSRLVQIFDTVFIWMFFVELLLRIVAIGPENFFMERRNNVDTVLVAIGIAFFFIPNNNNADGIVRMSRVFRLASLLRLLSHSGYLKGIKFELWDKLLNIYSILLEIMPIILRFMPLFVFVFYVYAIIGMELFYNFYSTQGSPNYNQYQEFSNFSSFFHAISVMVQVLTEAGWSQVAFDHCWRAPQYFTYIMLYFCLLHITIVYMIATLIKGVFWEVFFTVSNIFQARDKSSLEEEEREQQMQEKTQEIKEINEAIEQGSWIKPSTILRRQLIDNKFDRLVFRKLKKIYEKESHHNSSQRRMRSRRSFIAQHIINEWEIDLNELEMSQDVKNRQSKSEKDHSRHSESRQKLQLDEVEEVAEEDFESELEDMLNKLVINPKIKYSEIIASPKPFVDFLKAKLISPNQLTRDLEFDLRSQPFHNKNSMDLLTYEIHGLLGLETSKREQKAIIIGNLVEENVLSEEQGERLVKKRLQEKIFHVETNGVLRRLFTSGINPALMEKFEMEYFSDIYGHSFKSISKMSLEPLLKLQATLTHCLRTIMRYPQIDNAEFFEMLTSIEDQVSNKLLQKGSLFKLLYKLDCEGDVWFSIEYKRQQEMKVHFLKTGIWCYNRDMAPNEVLYAHDIFNWPFADTDRKFCEQYIKRFFQSFEGLAFSLLNEEEFFASNPQFHVYDLYLQHFEVERTRRFRTCKLEIAKVMVVVLSKEEERAELGLPPLPYELSDIKVEAPKRKKKKDFNFQFDDDDTYEKLKNIGAQSQEKIVESEGLPFAFVVDFMKEISDIVSIYAENLVFQIEKVLNEEYEEMQEEMNNSNNNPPPSPIYQRRPADTFPSELSFGPQKK